MVRIKRVYDPPAPDDGPRFLVERLWPRGMRKEALLMAGWLKEVAPSADLRRWYGHDPALWDEFKRRYRAKLDQLCVCRKEACDGGHRQSHSRARTRSGQCP